MWEDTESATVINLLLIYFQLPLTTEELMYRHEGYDARLSQHSISRICMSRHLASLIASISR